MLANEMLATRLAQELGIPVPEPAVIEVSSWLIEHTEELHCQLGSQRIPCVSGPCFGSRFVVDPAQGAVFDYLPGTMLCKVANLQDFARVLVLEWTCNSDGRQAIFARTGSRYKATFIDHGYCFNAGEWSFPDAPLRGVYANNSVYEDVRNWDSFEPVLSRAEQIDGADLATLTEGIPEEWWSRHDSEDLSRLVENLCQRRSCIRDLITTFRNSTRNPFPNWACN